MAQADARTLDPGARSFLFVPADDERRLARAFEREADALIVDLQDGVAPASKEVARAHAVAALHATGERPLRLVRINEPETEWGRDDLEALRGAVPEAVVVPRADRSRVDAASGYGHRLVALVETGRGLAELAPVALHPAVVALQLGAEDLSTELGLERRGDGLELLLARSSLVAASAAAGLRSPIDAVHPDLGDEDGLAAETELARTLGLGGKACIHPRQLATVNRLLAAAEDELGRARRIVAAFDAAGDAGAISVDGQMVDRAIVERARGTLERAGARQRDDDG